MAAVCARRATTSFSFVSHALPRSSISVARQQCRRSLQTSVPSQERPPDFAFAFDIDGVLLRSAKPLPRAQQALKFLQSHRIPFILLTNGGGKAEEERIAELSERLQVPLATDNFIQSHTPFTELVNAPRIGQQPLQHKRILVMGGDGDKCRRVAEGYGFTNVVTPGDLITTFPDLWPFASPTNYSFNSKRIDNVVLSPRDGEPPPNAIKIDAMFVFNDPRDWALDTQIILDLLMSHGGYLGSISPKNGTLSLPNSGWQQDGQPPLYFSNPDLFWAAAYHLPRLGQGGFKAAMRGLWHAATGGKNKGARLTSRMFGKPYEGTYSFAERRLQAHRNKLLGLGNDTDTWNGLKRVYMIGDNPESDILGANQYRSPSGTEWNSILVRSGVYSGGRPAHVPKAIVEDVWDAVRWGLDDSRWSVPEKTLS